MTSNVYDEPFALALQPDERVLWQGQPTGPGPAQPLLHTLGYSLAFLVSAGVTAVTAFATWRAVQGAEHFEWPFLLAFTLIFASFTYSALEFALLRPWRDRRTRARIHYAVTNARVLRAAPAPYPALTAIPLGLPLEVMTTSSATRQGSVLVQSLDGEQNYLVIEDVANPDRLSELILDAHRALKPKPDA
ncbi:MAG TPA: hypothetical protein DCL54_15350 [Alphaproteobacteria bacterium]|nr:hypothetical protein [Alphaproteobacteria bacterium]HAJ47947.1 hypothetical protein [Alphaproteobacteria bacterium]